MRTGFVPRKHGVCFAERLVLSDLGVGVEGRAALTIGLELLVYAIALWWLAPDRPGSVQGVSWVPERSG